MVFSPKVPRVPQGHDEIDEPKPTQTEKLANQKKTGPKPPPRKMPQRSAKRKANMALTEQGLAKVIKIQRKFVKRDKVKKRKITWDYVIYTPPFQFQDHAFPPDDPPDDDAPVDDDEGPVQDPHLQEDNLWQNLPFGGSEDDEGDTHSEVNTTDFEDFHSVQSLSDYRSPQHSPNLSLNEAFVDAHASDSPLSVRTMSPQSRMELEAQLQESSPDSEPQSLTWDNDPDLLNLTINQSLHVNVSDSNDNYSPDWDDLESSDVDSDASVFMPSFQSSTPQRVTRSMTSSGEYEATLSPIPFVRNSELRRPIIRWQRNVPEIADINQPASRRHQPAVPPPPTSQ